MEDVLAGFMKKYPGVEVVLNMRATAEIINDVATNEAHIGLAYNPPMTSGIAFCASAVHHIVAAVHPEHPLARCDDPVRSRRRWPIRSASCRRPLVSAC